MTDLNRVSATDIASKWSKVTHPEAAAIKSVDGLSAQVQKATASTRRRPMPR